MSKKEDRVVESVVVTMNVNEKTRMSEFLETLMIVISQRENEKMKQRCRVFIKPAI